MSIYDSSQFKKLKRLWYRKLKEAQFDDIETETGSLKRGQTAFEFFRNIGFKQDLFDSKRDYFIWAESMLTLGKFKNETDYLIWKLHSEGKTHREIATQTDFVHQYISVKIRRIRKYLSNG